MGEREGYAPGTFCWVDLATTDTVAARSFYSALFGWAAEDMEAREGVVYTMFRKHGDTVCGMFEMTDAMRATGVPPNWTSYVSVDDADAAAARAAELGGSVIDGAFDISDVGRMAVLRDPQGAVFAVWQPRRHLGAERVNDVGCLCMNELATRDLDAARSYYEGLFGWTTEAVDTAPERPRLAMAFNREWPNAAMFDMPDLPPHWRPCFTVESTRAALERVRELGGRPLPGPLELDHGTIGIALDPQGAVFALFAGETLP